MEVVLAILPPLELIEHAVGEGSEALGADEAAGVEEFTVTVDNLRLWLEPVITACAGDAVQVHDAWHGGDCRAAWRRLADWSAAVRQSGPQSGYSCTTPAACPHCPHCATHPARHTDTSRPAPAPNTHTSDNARMSMYVY